MRNIVISFGWLFLGLAVLAPLPAGAQDEKDTSGYIQTNPLPSDSLAADSLQSGAVTGQIEDDHPILSGERQAKLLAYSQFNNIWRFIEFFLGIGLLGLILFTGLSARLRDWAQVGRKSFLIVALFVAMFMIVYYLLEFLPSVYRGYLVEGEYGFVNQTFGEWLGEDLLGLLIGIVAFAAPVWFFYWLVGKTRRWWLWFAAGMVPITVFMVAVAPVVISPMFNKYEPLRDKQLETEILTLAGKAGIEGSDVFQMDASRQTTKVSAYVTGLLGTKRIVLFDTMLENFTTDEIKFVLGHEMAHYVKNHVWHLIALIVIFIGLGLWLTSLTIDAVIRKYQSHFRFDHLGDLASLPLVLIFISLTSFLFNPISNGYSRYIEHQSDKYSMDISGVSGDTAAGAFEKLSIFNLSDPDPHPFIEFWFYDHPPLKKRIEFVRTYTPDRETAH